MKKYIYILIAVLLLAGGAYLLSNSNALQGRFSMKSSGTSYSSTPAVGLGINIDLDKKVNLYMQGDIGHYSEGELSAYTADHIAFTVIAENIDDPNYDASDHLNVSIQLNGTSSTQSPVSTYEAWNHTAYVFRVSNIENYGITESGEYYVQATIDPYDKFDEQDETDNNYSDIIRVDF